MTLATFRSADALPLAFRVGTGSAVALAVLSLALVGGMLSSVAVEDIALGPLHCFGGERCDPDRTEQFLRLGLVGLSTTVLVAAALLASLRLRRGPFATVMLCALFGWLNCATSLLLVELMDGASLRTAAAALALGGLFGLPFGAPLGIVYGVVCAVPVERLQRLRSRPTLAGASDAARVVGLAVVVAAGLAALVAASRVAPLVSPWGPLALMSLGAAVLTGGCVVGARVRRLAADPERHGHARMPLAAFGAEARALLPLHDGVSPGAAFVLVREHATAAGAYRGGKARVPLARID